MTSVLITTIMRDNEKFIPYYHSQIKKLVEAYDYTFYVSIYENDSKDSSAEMLRSLDWSFLKDRIIIQTESIDTKKFGSEMSRERVDNLGVARMKSIYANDKKFLDQCDYVLAIESDFSYNIRDVGNLIEFKKNNGLRNVDIVSGVSINKMSDRTTRDTWATRTSADTPPHFRHGRLHENWQITKYGKYYTTFNGLCLYKAEPIKKGAAFAGFNKRLNTFDCDTAVICEDFHMMGYSDIYIDHTIRVMHCGYRAAPVENFKY